MRHFLWFYTQVMNNESELGDKLRQTIQTRPPATRKEKLKTSFLDRLSRSDEATVGSLSGRGQKSVNQIKISFAASDLTRAR